MFLGMVDEKQLIHIIDLVNSFVDEVARHPQYDIKQKHCSSNYSKQPIQFFIVAIR
jgi:hypothetical protein